MQIYKLGAKLPKVDSRTLLLARYLAPDLPPPPASIDWGGNLTTIGMMLNDRLGDCTIAGIGHGRQVMTSSALGIEVTVSDADVLKEYIIITGLEGAAYDPQTGANDNGAAVLDVLNNYRQNGMFGSKLDAYAAVTPTNQREVMDAIHLMGGCYLGIQLPRAWQGANQWTVPSHVPFFKRRLYDVGSWGGHAIWAFKYDQTGVWVITWGQKLFISWDAFFEYVKEAYALYKESDWTNQAGNAPNGLDKTALLQDVAILAST